MAQRLNNFDELLEAAKRTPDLEGALASIGVELRQIGRSQYGIRYATSTQSGIAGDYSSVAFIHNYDGTWIAIDNKERTGRKELDAIGVLTKLYGLSFNEAVYALTGTSAQAGIYQRAQKPIIPKAPTMTEQKEFVLPPKREKASWIGKKYLMNDRLLPKPIVDKAFELGVVYMPYIPYKQSEKPQNLIGWAMRDEHGNIVGLECEATFKTAGKPRYKHIVFGSNNFYGTKFSNNIDKLPEGMKVPIYFCESAVDAMSLLSLKNLSGIYVSMTGVKDSLVKNVCEKIGGFPVICCDRDEAGMRFRAQFPDAPTLYPEYGKDWNDELVYRVVHGMDYALKSAWQFSQDDVCGFLERQIDMLIKERPMIEDDIAGLSKQLADAEQLTPKQEQDLIIRLEKLCQKRDGMVEKFEDYTQVLSGLKASAEELETVSLSQ